MNTADRIKVTRLRNEIAFICGDLMHGGPDRTHELAGLRAQLKQIEDGGSDGRPDDSAAPQH